MKKGGLVSEDEVKENNIFYKRLFSPIFELLLFAVGSSLAYGFIFLYECGFASVFSIPLSFVTVDLTWFASRAGILLVIIMFLFWFYWQVGSIFAVSPNKNIKTYVWLLLLVPFFVMFGYPIYIFISSYVQWKDYLLLGFIVVIPLWFYFLTFVTLPKTIKTITNDNDEYLTSKGMGVLSIVSTPEGKKKLRDFLEKPKKVPNKEIWNKFKAYIYSFLLNLLKFDSKIVFILFLIVWCLPCSLLCGRIVAYSAEDFLISNTLSKKLIVLRRYGDNVISVPFMREEGKIRVQKDFVIFRLGDDIKLKLHSEKIKSLYLMLRK